MTPRTSAQWPVSGQEPDEDVTGTFVGMVLSARVCVPRRAFSNAGRRGMLPLPPRTGASECASEVEETGKRIRVRGHLLDWPLDRVVDEIRQACADCSLLEATRLAHGLTRQQLSWAVDALYEEDGLAPPHLDPSDIWAWERGRHQPTPEHQRYLTRAYRTRPDRLGFGEDHSRPAQEGAPAAASAGSVIDVIEGTLLPDHSGPPSPASADELVVAVRPGIRRVSLCLPVAPGSGAERWTWSEPSRWPPPGAIVGLAEDRVEIAVVARCGRSEP
jgi:hypothetical protein